MRNICCSRKPDLVKPQGSGQDKLSEMVWVLAGQRSEWAVQNSQHEELNPSKQDRLSDGVVWNYIVSLGFFHPFQPLLPDLISKQPNPQTAPTVSSLPSFTWQYFANISHPLGVSFYNFSKKIFFFFAVCFEHTPANRKSLCITALINELMAVFHHGFQLCFVIGNS